MHMASASDDRRPSGDGSAADEAPDAKRSNLGVDHSIARLFKLADANGDGKISHSEFDNILSDLKQYMASDRCPPVGFGATSAELSFAGADADGSSGLDLKEFAAFGATVPPQAVLWLCTMLTNKTLELMPNDGGQHVEFMISEVERIPLLKTLLADTGYQSVCHHMECTSAGLRHARRALQDGGQSLSTPSMIAAVPSARFARAKEELTEAEADFVQKESTSSEVKKTGAEETAAAAAVAGEIVAELETQVTTPHNVEIRSQIDQLRTKLQIAEAQLEAEMSRISRAKQAATDAAKVVEDAVAAALAAEENIMSAAKRTVEEKKARVQSMLSKPSAEDANSADREALEAAKALNFMDCDLKKLDFAVAIAPALERQLILAGESGPVAELAFEVYQYMLELLPLRLHVAVAHDTRAEEYREEPPQAAQEAFVKLTTELDAAPAAAASLLAAHESTEREACRLRAGQKDAAPLYAAQLRKSYDESKRLDTRAFASLSMEEMRLIVAQFPDVASIVVSDDFVTANATPLVTTVESSHPYKDQGWNGSTYTVQLPIAAPTATIAFDLQSDMKSVRVKCQDAGFDSTVGQHPSTILEIKQASGTIEFETSHSTGYGRSAEPQPWGLKATVTARGISAIQALAPAATIVFDAAATAEAANAVKATKAAVTAAFVAQAVALAVGELKRQGFGDVSLRSLINKVKKKTKEEEVSWPRTMDCPEEFDPDYASLEEFEEEYPECEDPESCQREGAREGLVLVTPRGSNDTQTARISKDMILKISHWKAARLRGNASVTDSMSAYTTNAHGRFPTVMAHFAVTNASATVDVCLAIYTGLASIVNTTESIEGACVVLAGARAA